MRDSAFPSGSSAFSGLLAEPGRRIGTEAVWACERRHCATATMITRRGRFSELQQKVAAGCGVTLIDGPKRSAAGALGFVGTAPLQWLAVHDEATPGWPRPLVELLDGAASVSDQSGGQVVLRVGGAGAHALLSRALFVDLHPWSFGPDDAATTHVSQVGITIWQRTEVRAYELAFTRSYAESIAHWLQLNAVVLVSDG